MYNGSQVRVETWAHPDEDSIGVKIESDLLRSGALGVFVDFPYPTLNKFEAPFIGVFNATNSHKTALTTDGSLATIQHDLDATRYFVSLAWDGGVKASRLSPSAHRYTFTSSAASNETKVVVKFGESQSLLNQMPSFDGITKASEKWWETFWMKGAFVDLRNASSPEAAELQRRTILSLYLTAVNSASSNPPQGTC